MSNYEEYYGKEIVAQLEALGLPVAPDENEREPLNYKVEGTNLVEIIVSWGNFGMKILQPKLAEMFKIWQIKSLRFIPVSEYYHDNGYTFGYRRGHSMIIEHETLSQFVQTEGIENLELLDLRGNSLDDRHLSLIIEASRLQTIKTILLGDLIFDNDIISDELLTNNFSEEGKRNLIAAFGDRLSWQKGLIEGYCSFDVKEI